MFSVTFAHELGNSVEDLLVVVQNQLPGGLLYHDALRILLFKAVDLVAEDVFDVVVPNRFL